MFFHGVWSRMLIFQDVFFLQQQLWMRWAGIVLQSLQRCQGDNICSEVWCGMEACMMHESREEPYFFLNWTVTYLAMNWKGGNLCWDVGKKKNLHPYFHTNDSNVHLWFLCVLLKAMYMLYKLSKLPAAASRHMPWNFAWWSASNLSFVLLLIYLLILGIEIIFC